MERYTVKHVESSFNVLMNVAKLRLAKSYDDVGGFMLEKWGRKYRIVQIVNEVGARSTPFGSSWRNARDMIDCMYFAQNMVWTQEQMWTS